MNKFDNYEIHPCREDENHSVEQCEPEDAHFWTVYGHIEGEGIEAIGDFKTFEHAKEVYSKITGEIYV